MVKLVSAVIMLWAIGFCRIAFAQNAVAAPASSIMIAANDTDNVRPIRLAAIGSIAGFADSNLPNGGLFTDIVLSALGYSKTNGRFDVEFLSPDAPGFFQKLAEEGFDLSFPWFLPDCTNLAPLNDLDRYMCTDYIASQPYFQITVGMYTTPKSRFVGALTAQDITGAHICRPAGFIEFDLAQMGLMPPQIMLANPQSLAECLQGLVLGEYDVVSADTRQIESIALDLGLMARILPIQSLESTQTMHVLAARNNPNSRVNLAILERGMRQLRENGDWFTIVATHLAALN